MFLTFRAIKAVRSIIDRLEKIRLFICSARDLYNNHIRSRPETRVLDFLDSFGRHVPSATNGVLGKKGFLHKKDFCFYHFFFLIPVREAFPVLFVLTGTIDRIPVNFIGFC